LTLTLKVYALNSAGAPRAGDEDRDEKDVYDISKPSFCSPNSKFFKQSKTFRSYVLSPAKNWKSFGSASYGHQVRRASVGASEQEMKFGRRSGKENALRSDEDLVTTYPYEAVGQNVLWPGICY